jgi:hypothetical protein
MFDVPSKLANQTKLDNYFPSHNMMSHLTTTAHAPPQIAVLLPLKLAGELMMSLCAPRHLQGWLPSLNLPMTHLFCLGKNARDLETPFRHQEDLFCVFSFQILISRKQIKTLRFFDLVIFFIY